MASLIETQSAMRSGQIGQTAIANMEEALARNHQVGIVDGLRLVPKIVLASLQSYRDRYVALLMKERGEEE